MPEPAAGGGYSAEMTCVRQRLLLPGLVAEEGEAETIVPRSGSNRVFANRKARKTQSRWKDLLKDP